MGATEEIGGAKLDVIDVGAGIKLYFDAEGVLVRRSEEGSRGTVVSSWSDFRKVDGASFPFASITEADGQKLIDAKLDKVEVNPEVAADTFKKPAGPEFKPGTPSGAKQGGEKQGQGN